MIDQERIQNFKQTLDSALLNYDEKEIKSIDTNVLYRFLERINDFHDFNKGEINKLVMLLEYTIYSIEKKDIKEYKQRYKTLRGHLTKYFGVYVTGELQGIGTGIGLSIGVGVGLAIGSAMGNPGMGLPIGIGVGISLGVALGASKEKKLKEEGKIL